MKFLKFSTRTGRKDQLQVIGPRDGCAKTWKTEVLQKCKIQNKNTEQ